MKWKLLLTAIVLEIFWTGLFIAGLFGAIFILMPLMVGFFIFLCFVLLVVAAFNRYKKLLQGR